MWLPFIELNWTVMKQACKFAFFQASRPKHSWNKASTVSYLKQCGIGTQVAETVYNAAREMAKANRNRYNACNYGEEDKIGKFHFPVSWLSTQVTLQDHIEAPMHLLFLGIAESNYDLTTKKWLSTALQPQSWDLRHSEMRCRSLLRTCVDSCCHGLARTH